MHRHLTVLLGMTSVELTLFVLALVEAMLVAFEITALA